MFLYFWSDRPLRPLYYLGIFIVRWIPCPTNRWTINEINEVSIQKALYLIWIIEASWNTAFIQKALYLIWIIEASWNTAFILTPHSLTILQRLLKQSVRNYHTILLCLLKWLVRNCHTILQRLLKQSVRNHHTKLQCLFKRLMQRNLKLTLSVWFTRIASRILTS